MRYTWASGTTQLGQEPRFPDLHPVFFPRQPRTRERGGVGGRGREAGTCTHIHSEVFETSEFAEVFLKFGVNVQIFGFGIFQEGPEFLQPIELTCRERGERQRKAGWCGERLGGQ